MNILDKIIESKRQEVKAIKAGYSKSSFSDSPLFSTPCLSLMGKIRNEHDITLIAEVKKASPSRGIIREDFNHLEIARTYSESGASAISVLTDIQFFKGSILFLKDIALCKTLPILRKDFIIDEIQIYEARANGADAILLISEVLDKREISELTIAANELGMEVLLELHSSAQLDKIDFTLNPLIGINNRDLSSFTTDIKTTTDLSVLLPEDVLIVSESGIINSDSINILKQTRADAVLVGEHFMRMTDIGCGVKEFRQWCIR